MVKKENQKLYKKNIIKVNTSQGIRVIYKKSWLWAIRHPGIWSWQIWCGIINGWMVEYRVYFIFETIWLCKLSQSGARDIFVVEFFIMLLFYSFLNLIYTMNAMKNDCVSDVYILDIIYYYGDWNKADWNCYWGCGKLTGEICCLRDDIITVR